MKITKKLIPMLSVGLGCFAAVQSIDKINDTKGESMNYIDKSATEELCAIPDIIEGFGKIGTTTLNILIHSNANFILLDARSAKWDDGQRIPGALSLTNEDPIQKFRDLIPELDSLVVVYCSNSQCGASDRLIKRLTELDYSCILKYPEGIEEWIKKGNLTTKNK